MRKPRLGRIIIAALLIGLVVFLLQMCADSRQKRRAYEASLGTWQNAYADGTLLKETFKKETSGNTVITISHKLFDTTGDGVPDFEISEKWGKPFEWRYLDSKGEPYG